MRPSVKKGFQNVTLKCLKGILVYKHFIQDLLQEMEERYNVLWQNGNRMKSGGER